MYKSESPSTILNQKEMEQGIEDYLEPMVSRDPEFVHPDLGLKSCSSRENPTKQKMGATEWCAKSKSWISYLVYRNLMK